MSRQDSQQLGLALTKEANTQGRATAHGTQGLNGAAGKIEDEKK